MWKDSSSQHFGVDMNINYMVILLEINCWQMYELFGFSDSRHRLAVFGPRPQLSSLDFRCP